MLIKKLIFLLLFSNHTSGTWMSFTGTFCQGYTILERDFVTLLNSKKRPTTLSASLDNCTFVSKWKAPDWMTRKGIWDSARCHACTFSHFSYRTYEQSRWALFTIIVIIFINAIEEQVERIWHIRDKSMRAWVVPRVSQTRLTTLGSEIGNGDGTTLLCMVSRWIMPPQLSKYRSRVPVTTPNLFSVAGVYVKDSISSNGKSQRDTGFELYAYGTWWNYRKRTDKTNTILTQAKKGGTYG